MLYCKLSYNSKDLISLSLILGHFEECKALPVVNNQNIKAAMKLVVACHLVASL